MLPAYIALEYLQYVQSFFIVLRQSSEVRFLIYTSSSSVNDEMLSGISFLFSNSNDPVLIFGIIRLAGSLVFQTRLPFLLFYLFLSVLLLVFLVGMYIFSG